MEIKHRWTKAVLFSFAGNLVETLREATKARAYLSGADLSGADLSGADLSGADLSGAKEDVRSLLSAAPKEVLGLLETLRAGRFDGSHYEGECACLVGTIAKVRGVVYTDVVGLRPDSSRPAERFALGIRQGDTPANHPLAKMLDEWISEWLVENSPAVQP